MARTILALARQSCVRLSLPNATTFYHLVLANGMAQTKVVVRGPILPVSQFQASHCPLALTTRHFPSVARTIHQLATAGLTEASKRTAINKSRLLYGPNSRIFQDQFRFPGKCLDDFLLMLY
jgi:hypothetical protein